MTAGASVVPANVLGRGAAPPSERLNVACIGVGGRGGASVHGVAGENIVALCDVDTSRMAKARQQLPRAKAYQDFRRLFDEQEKQIDAVTVAVPDHSHAVIAMTAIKLGKHVYCEKPLAHSLHEVRSLTEAARAYRVQTQLGNQGHSSNSIREFCELIWAGAIGTVKEVHAFVQHDYCPKPRVQPLERPPVPPTLDWDQWIGPAPWRPYHPLYHPGSWRKWVPFGTGITGDWVCHVLDPIFWALDLGAPTRVLAKAVDYDDPRIRAESFPPGCVIRWDFPAKDRRPPVRINWYEGSVKPPRPPQLEPGRQLPQIGAVVVGTNGVIMHGSHGAAGSQLLPAARWKAYRQPDPSIPRVRGHHNDWLQACKGGHPAGSNFDYGGPLTKVALLGVLGLRFNGHPLEWNADTLKVTNLPEANAWVNPPYRKGWSL